MIGNSFIFDIYGCNSDELNSEEFIHNVAIEILQIIGADIIQEHIHHFTPGGITYSAIISASHISIHTWPEKNFMTLDIFSCSMINLETLLKQLDFYIEKNIKLSNVICTHVKRGESIS